MSKGYRNFKGVMDLIGEDIHSSGVYTIENLVNGKLYVGSASSDTGFNCDRGFRRRWNSHLSLLRSNKHYNTKLQNSFNKYGETNFRFEILEVTSPDIAIDMEQYWINILRPEYNIRMVASNNKGIKMSHEQKVKSSRSKGGKRFEVYLLEDDSYVGTWDLKSKCSEELNIPVTYITRCLKGERRHANGYKFKHEGDDFTYRCRLKDRPIRKGWNHSKETKSKISKSHKGKKLSKETKKKLSDIMKKRDDSFYDKFRVKYTKDQSIEHARRLTKGTLYVYDKSGNFIAKYESLYELCNDLNLKANSVCAVLSGKRNSLNGYIVKRIIKENN